MCEVRPPHRRGGANLTPRNLHPGLRVTNFPTGKTRWLLVENYHFHWEYQGRWYRLSIPAGFITDGASVPRILRWVAGRGRFGTLAPLVHDWMHHVSGWVAVELLAGGGWVACDSTVRWTRRQADCLFCRIMREDGVEPRWLRRGAFQAVRAWSLIKGDKWAESN